MEIVLAFWALTVGFLAGGKMATSQDLRVTTIESRHAEPFYLRPCIGAHDQDCGK